MTVFADSHAHLADPAFDADRDAVIDRARATGARLIVCIGESPDAADRARDVARAHPGLIRHTAGVHPHDAGTFDTVRDIARLEQHVTDGAVAIGECGLDYHYDNAPRDVQRRVFEAQVDLAARTRLPLVVHTREAALDTAAVIATAHQAGVRGVLHCFTGPPSLAEAALDAGWFISFSGVITFRKWNDDALLRSIPVDRLLVESDAPYLAPVPHRGKRNEPAHVSLTIARLALARGVMADDLGAQTLTNATEFFSLARDDAAV